MPAPNLPNTLLKLGLALAKHHIKNVIGDEALEIAASTLTDVGGEKVQAKVDSIFASKEGQKELLKAAKSADESFKEKCKDNDLRQLFTMDYGNLPSVQEAVGKLPEALDDDALQETLFTAFRNDTPKRISDEQINEGVNLYMECLQSALLPIEDFGQRIIHNALKEIGKDVKDIKADVKWLKEKEETGRQSASDIKNINPVFYVPFPRNEKFVGREDDLEKLHDALQQGESVGVRPAMLSGMGGIGKTQLAVEYSYRYLGKYPGGIYWVNAAHDMLLTGMAEAAEKIGLSAEDVPESQRSIHLANTLTKHLNSHPNALVIFDNVEDPQVLRLPIASFIPSELKCKILFTTRRRDVEKTFYRSFEVTILPENVALKLLLRHPSRQSILSAKHPDHGWARVICKTLGYLPLALELAGAFLGEFSEIALKDYRFRLLDEGAMETIDDTDLLPTDMPTRHDTAIRATLKLSWEAIQDDTNAQLALKAAGQLHEAELISIHRLSLLTGLEMDAKGGHPALLGRSLKKLLEFSLVEELTADHLRLHPLIFAFAFRLADNDFRIQIANRLTETLCDVETLNQIVAKNSIDTVLADVRTGLWLYGKYSNNLYKELSLLERLLDGEAHHLRYWSPDIKPAYFVQQLYNRALNLNIMEWQNRFENFFEKTHLTWICERFQPPRESSSLLRTISGITNILKITPNGMVASVLSDNTIKIWDLASGQEIQEFSGNNANVYDVAISKDCRIVVSSSPVVDYSDLGSIDVWDFSSGQKINTFPGYTHHLALTPNGRMVLSVARNGMKVLDVSNGQELPLSLNLGGSLLNDIVITQDSRFAFFAFRSSTRGINFDSQIIVDLTNGQVRNLNGDGCVAIIPNSRLAISSAYHKKFKIWDIGTGKVLRIFSGNNPETSCIAITPNGRMAISSHDKILKVWDIESGKVLNILSGHDDIITDIAITPDSSQVISASLDASLRVWDLSSGQELQILFGHSHPVRKVKVSPDGSLIVSLSEDKTLKVWDLSIHSETRNTSRHSGNVCSIAVTPNNKYALSASDDKSIKIWDITNGNELRTLSGLFSKEALIRSMANGIAISPDSRLAISIFDRTLKVWNIDNGKKKRTISEFFLNNFSSITGLAITPDCQSVVSTSDDDTLTVWNIANGKKLQTMRHTLKRDYGIQSVALTPDGILIITACGKDLHIWDFATGQKIRTLSKHTETVSALTISSDSKLVISASKDKTLKVWNIASGQVLKNLVGHNDVVWSVAIKPNGYLAASVSEDKTLRIWNIVSGKELLTFPSETPLYSVAIAPDGKRLITGDNLGGVRFFDIVNL